MDVEGNQLTPQQRQDKLKEILKQLIQPLNVIAPLAVVATAYAYFLGWSYFSALYSDAGAEWIMRDMNALEIMSAPMYLLSIAGVAALLALTLYADGVLSIKRMGLILSLTVLVCFVSFSAHFAIEAWWSKRYESHWNKVFFAATVILMALLPVMFIAKTIEGRVNWSAQIYFFNVVIMVLLLPFYAQVLGKQVTKSQFSKDESTLSRVKIDGVTGCEWRLVRTISSGDYLLALPNVDSRIRPQFRIVKTEAITRIFDHAVEKCGAP